jgi:hypothetical protein
VANAGAAASPAMVTPATTAPARTKLNTRKPFEDH